MKLYKLTDSDGKTYGETQWGENITHTGTGEGEMCGPGWIHAYTDPYLAVIFNPIHANFTSPLIWEAEGEVIKNDGCKVGCRKLTTGKEVSLPPITTNQLVSFGILAAKTVCCVDSMFLAWANWANNWLSDKDRSGAAAEAAAGAAWAAEAAAEAARAAGAAWAAEAAAGAARAAEAAAEAARAARAAWAAEAAAGAAWAAEAAAEAARTARAAWAAEATAGAARAARAAEAAAEAARAAWAAEVAAGAARAAWAAEAAAEAARAAEAAAEAAEATGAEIDFALNLAEVLTKY